MTDLLSPDQALSALLAAVPTPRVQNLPPERCIGLVVADDVFAAADLPPFARAMMDGFAVRSSDAGTMVTVLDEIAAGDGAVRAVLAAGHAHPIMTGAPVPPGADAVVAWEICTRTGNTVQLPDTIRSGANIVARGAECAAGHPWLRRGQVVTPMTVAAAIATDNTELSVCVPPTVAVLTTGSELSDRAGHGLIRDSNGPMLVALLHQAGIAAERTTVGDDPVALKAHLERLGDLDAVILTGGVSTGTHDDVPAVLRQLGATILFHKIEQKPGKPLLIAQRGRQLIFALPGNPLAVHWCACGFVLPALRHLMSRSGALAWGHGRLGAALSANGERTWFIPAHVNDAGVVLPLAPVSSADLVQPHQANAYLRRDPGAPTLSVGSDVTFIRIGTA